MPLKLSANLSLLFTEQPLLKRLHAAKQAGFNAVEVQFPYECPQEDWQAQLKEDALQMVLINLPAGDLMQGGEGLACVPKREQDFRKALEQGLRYAEALGAETMNVLPGRCLPENRLDNGQAPAAYTDTLLENLHRAANALQDIGVRTTFEAINTDDMPGFLIHSAAQMEVVIAQINHPNLWMQYDVYHMQRMNEPIAEQLPQLIERIGHIQFADCPGRHEPGTGKLPLEDYLRQLSDLHYPYWLGAEYNPRTATTQSLGWKSHWQEQGLL